MTGTIYHPVEFDVTYQNCLSDYKDNLYHKGLINHDELMALISGGMAARKAYIESHSSLLYEEIIDVSMYYNLNRRVILKTEYPWMEGQIGKKLQDNRMAHPILHPTYLR